MENKRFEHDGMTLKQMVNALPEISENRTRLMIYFRHVANYAIRLEDKLLSENKPQSDTPESEGEE